MAGKIDRSFPVEMLPCRLCGQLPKLHFNMFGKWYCCCPKKHGTDLLTPDKLEACRDWNRHNIEHNSYLTRRQSEDRAAKECGRC